MLVRLRVAISTALLFVLAFAASRNGVSWQRPSSDSMDAKVEALLAQMTLEEKLGQLQLLDNPAAAADRAAALDLVRRGLVGGILNAHGARQVNELQRLAMQESRLKIPLLFGYDVVHGYRTIFPVPLGEASSWDPSLAEETARIAATEARAAGVNWTFAPMVDIARDARWGRIVEGAGEDPFLGAEMARARVRGFQGRALAAPDAVAACVKHFAAYGAAEAGRDYNTTDLSEWTLREVYLPPFKAAIDAGVETVMSAFNDLNGVPASANPFLLTDILRGEWKFAGFVVSDYTAVPELIAHGLAADEADAAAQALNAGLDMEMVSRLFNLHGVRLVRQGKVPLARIDEAVRRILRLKFRLGLFDRPYVDETHEARLMLAPAHLDAARRAAARSLVLLKNQGDLLPLRKDLRAIAVIGPLADSQRDVLGPWHAAGRAEEAVTLLQGIRAKVGAKTELLYAKGCEIEGGTTDGIAEAVRIAKAADVAIVAVGESAEMSGEAASRTSLALPGHQLALVKAIQATGKPTVVVLMNGRPLAIEWVAENVPAILETWFAGIQAGYAIADVLFGDVNPGGKLPVTFPRTVGQAPLYYNHKNTGRPPQPNNKYTSKYIDAPWTPLFPFGHGLSYTQFRFSNLHLSRTRLSVNERLVVTVDVENTGQRAGDEVVQLYIRDVAASATRPVRELKGFARITLAAGERRTVRFELGPEHLGAHDRHMRFVVEPGEFRLYVGNSSAGGLEARFDVFD